MGQEVKVWGFLSPQVNGDSLGSDIRSGAPPLSGSAHSPDTWPQVWEAPHKLCEIKSA